MSRLMAYSSLGKRRDEFVKDHNFDINVFEEQPRNPFGPFLVSVSHPNKGCWVLVYIRYVRLMIGKNDIVEFFF